MTLRAFVSRRDYGRFLEVHLIDERPDGSADVIEPVTVRHFADSSEIYNKPWEPALRLDIFAAQSLMDELWVAGIRPAEALRRNESGMTAHLEDMRAIVAAKLGVKLPGTNSTGADK